MILALSHSLVPTARDMVFGFKDPRPGTAISAAEEKVLSTQQDVADTDR